MNKVFTWMLIIIWATVASGLLCGGSILLFQGSLNDMSTVEGRLFYGCCFMFGAVTVIGKVARLVLASEKVTQ